MPNFVNRMLKDFPKEVDEANIKAFEALDYSDKTAPGPFGANSDSNGKNWDATSGFKTFVARGTKFKWVLIRRGPGKPYELNVVSCILKHSVAAGGGDVITAGHGYLKPKTKNTIVLDNDTGHYQTSLKSLNEAKPAWTGLGYTVETQERIDYKKLF